MYIVFLCHKIAFITERLGDRLKDICDKLAGYLRETPPDRPETVPLEKIDQSAVTAAYQRWLNFPTVMRLVRKENCFPIFTLTEILWALGHLGANRPLNQFSNPKGRGTDFKNVRDRVYQVLSQLKIEEIVDQFPRKNSNPDELRYFYRVRDEQKLVYLASGRQGAGQGPST